MPKVLLLLSLLICPFALRAVGVLIDYPEQGTTFELSVKKYEPPLVIVDGQLEAGQQPPEWWAAYDALKNYRDGRDYASWIRHFSPALQRVNGYGPERFAAMQQSRPTAVSNPPVRSVLYQVQVLWAGRHIVVVKVVNERVTSYPADLQDLPMSSTTLVFEKGEDGVWCNQWLQDSGPGIELPYNDLRRIDAIMEAGCVYYHHGLKPGRGPAPVE
ncbi:hypothetical protein [Ruficoccus sp. ZRK36]|uniref:hypothetical protein n=1 Tax=Ruficoccus sp. ZRK36 TaxID=2866311 RepID=UPI001C739D6D|nr:hypothetical protein [Ruficoccus sp. ZRK36]QYY37199.1 hypothetical protein K0V07_06870 [Ruficoccus sp. ZRK36]